MRALAATYGVGLVLWAALVLWVVLDPPTGSADGRAIVAAFIVLAAVLHLGSVPAIAGRRHDEAD